MQPTPEKVWFVDAFSMFKELNQLPLLFFWRGVPGVPPDSPNTPKPRPSVVSTHQNPYVLWQSWQPRNPQLTLLCRQRRLEGSSLHCQQEISSNRTETAGGFTVSMVELGDTIGAYPTHPLENLPK